MLAAVDLQHTGERASRLVWLKDWPVEQAELVEIVPFAGMLV